ncbi:uncharacterized protein B0H18DRAFT_1212765 [Fomitopsis serialis]|uniref:uncharacterized protein n=1 Tax=Fomitopsis serialis TaxID=139415 RepID=UPI00200890E6|nr:uncharacterized protein B0H18DRAFT_1212765 [Neoantrodia serialis]KAH9922100.1 hypothetical protein B0H18DRAFT_1212765 [Neoantrodia serialis]
MQDTLEHSLSGSRNTENAADHMSVEQEATRDEQFWFRDGNVVLQAGGVAFRVYQGTLSQNSEVFDGLFSVPQPVIADTFDGCPVIQLEDRPDDLRHLLRALFVGQRFYRHDEQLPFTVVASIVRLAHKYGMEHLRDDALERMKSCFSDDLDVWSEADVGMGSASMSYVDTDAIAAVSIARLTDTYSMLPSALYTCCQLDTEEIVNGVTREDGTTERLTQEDMLRCLNARRTLLHDNIVSAYTLFTTTPHGCTRHSDCELMRRNLADTHITFDTDGVEDYAYLADWDPYFRNKELSGSYHSLCPNCQAAILEHARELRLAAWTSLSKTLNLIA